MMTDPRQPIDAETRILDALDEQQAVYARALDWCREQVVSPVATRIDRPSSREGWQAILLIPAAAVDRCGLDRRAAMVRGRSGERRIHEWTVDVGVVVTASLEVDAAGAAVLA